MPARLAFAARNATMEATSGEDGEEAMDQQAAMLAALFEKSLNLGPEWKVVDAEFREVEGGKDELHVFVERATGRAMFCTACGGMHGVYDAREREWRHLDIWQYKTIVHCKVPRVECPLHGVVTVKVPWEADDAKHFTALFAAQVVVMALSGLTVKAIAGLLGETDTRLWRLLGACVARARAAADYSGVRAVGVDETAKRRGHDYLSAFVDLDARRVVSVQEGRDAGTVAGFADDLAAHGGDATKVEVVTCDLSAAFASGVAVQMPQAARVADRFHVVQLLTKAVDRVRAAEARESKEKAALLRRTRWLWLKNEANLKASQLSRKRDLAKENLKTGRACAMKEAMQRVYDSGSREEAAGALDALASWMAHSNLAPMKPVAKTLRKNREAVLAYFDHRRTNSVLEGLNSVIQSVKRSARGYRNFENFKAMIFLHLGRLSLGIPQGCGTH